ncbi:hypothetical protein HQ563_07940 [bacterium]|nr:hypothetical protein [bacterium]
MMFGIFHSPRFCSARFKGWSWAGLGNVWVLILALSLLSVAGLVESSMTTGSYTGNGSSQSITTLGFTPEIVIIKGNTNKRAVMRTDTMTDGTNNTKDLVSMSGLQANCITSLVLNGFTVGSDLRVNQSGNSYYWVAFNAEGSDAETGTYTGNGSSPRDITTGFTPMYVIVLPEAAAYAVQRSQTMPTGYTFGTSAGASNSITSLGTNKFTVGSTLNTTDVTYHYVAFKPVSGKMTLGLYLGNGQDNRQISGMGFQPIYVIIKCNDNKTAHRPSSLTGDKYLAFDTSSFLSNGIQALLTDGFEVGTSTTVNQDFQLCHYVAFGESYTAVKLTSLNATGLPDRVLVEWETDTEIDTVGFNVLRSETPEEPGPWVRLNQSLIPSLGSSWEGASYTFQDEERNPGTVFWYCVEEVNTGGGTVRYPAQLVWDDGLADADGDGMPDLWEQRLGIDTGSEADADGDADGDGATNLEEYLAGTSPVDAEDCPRLRIQRREESGLPALIWPGRPGRMYRLTSADSVAELLSGSGRLDCVIPGTSSRRMELKGVPGEGERARFYRLIISPPQ